MPVKRKTNTPANATTTDDESPVYDPRDPRTIARDFKKRKAPSLITFEGELYLFNGAFYEPVSLLELREQVYRTLEGSYRMVNEALRPFCPTRSNVADVEHALLPMTHAKITDPAWRDGGAGLPEPTRIIAARNGLWRVDNGELVRVGNPTPNYFSRHALPYNVDPTAHVPREWIDFLDSVCDRETQRLLQAWAYYCLTADTSQQKMLLIVGPTRSGKGTFARILRALVGDDNTAGPTLASLGTNFGLWVLIGKPLAIVSDARLGRADHSIVTERLLSITGEDTLTIDRKNLTPLTLKLGTRFTILTNELPRLTDSSGALANRCIIASFPNSFLGREDTGLTDRLLAALPGILRWAAAGQLILMAEGRFPQPAAGLALQQELEDLTSPAGEFARACCEVNPNASELCSRIYAAWRGWCKEQGRDHPGPANLFSRDLRSAVSGIKTSNRRQGPDDTRARTYMGIQLNAEGDRLAITGSIGLGDGGLP